MASTINADKKKVKNSERILMHVISRIDQKIKLDNNTKKQISDFVLSRMTGGIKVEFVDELPTGEFAYGEFEVKDYQMRTYNLCLAYGECFEIKYQDVLYVAIKKATVKEVQLEEPEVCEETEIVESVQDNPNVEIIRQKIVSRIKLYFMELNVFLEDEARIQIENFLALLVSGRVWVKFEEIPEEGNYQYKNILVSNHMLKLAYGHNEDDDSKYPNVLYVSVVEAYELAFRDFWRKNYFPTCLLEDAMKHLDFSQQITVVVYERAYLWRDTYELASNPIVFGQEINSEGQFKSRLPIGFVNPESNFVAITSPNERIGEGGGITYKFN